MRVALALALVLAASCERAVKPGPVPPSPTPIEALEGRPPPATTSPPRYSDRNIGIAYVDPGARDPKPVTEAIAILHPTRENTAIGVVRFRVIDGELNVAAAVDGLSAGTHAYHIHVFGDCSAPDASSAGPHFHFTGSAFDQSVPMITGNLGELRVTGRQTTTHQARLRDASLHGPFSIIGRSVVVHEQGNNPAVTPDGGAGKRLACGVIGVADHTPPQQTRR